jgi:3-methyladenine DNA glycosylase AlkD
VPVSDDGRYYPLIYEACAVLIRREERFAKTGVGWILRDVSKHDKDGVRQFVEQHLESFSIESVKNALKYLDEKERKKCVQGLKVT